MKDGENDNGAAETLGWHRYWADHGGWDAVAGDALAQHAPAWASLGCARDLAAVLEQLGRTISATGAEQPRIRLHQELGWALATRRRGAGLVRPAPLPDPSARFLRTVPRRPTPRHVQAAHPGVD